MAVALSPALLLDVVAAFATVLVAVALVRARSGSGTNWAIGLFLLVRGVSSATRTLSLGADSAGAALFWSRSAMWYELAFLATVAGVLAYVPTPLAHAGWRRGIVAAGVAGSILVGAMFFARPDRFLSDPAFFADRGFWWVANGPGMHAVNAAATLAYAAMVVHFARRFAETPGGAPARDRAFILLLGASVTLAYALGFSGATLHLQAPRMTMDVSFGAQFASGVAASLVAAGAIGFALMHTRGMPDGRRRVGHALLLLVPVAAGFFDGAQVWLDLALPGYTTSAGLWRFATALVIGWGILKYDLFDVEIRVKRGIAVGLGFGVLALLFVGGVFGTLAVLGSDPVAIAFAQVVGAGLALLAFSRVKQFGAEVAQRVFPRAHVENSGYVLDRKLAVYRAALERAIETGDATASETGILKTLRTQLGITDREHAALEHVVRATVRGPHRPELDPGGLILGRYRVGRILGQGGFGRTFLARDETLGRDVAVKEWNVGTMADPERALREARLLAGVNHPNVVTLLDVERVGDEIFLVMEYASGGNLKDRLHAGPLPPEAAASIAAGLLAALEAAHNRGILHRDVKPANILFDGDGRVKLADFGIARNQDADATRMGLSAIGMQPGTLAYMSPEQARGIEVDARSDLYSAAVVLHECFAHAPYLDLRNLGEFEIRESIITDVPTLAHVKDPLVRGFLERALAKDPGNRFADASAMAASLGEVAKSIHDASMALP